MDWDGDLAQLPVVPPGHEKDVKTLLQNLSSTFETSGPEFQAKFLSSQNACSDHLTFIRAPFPSWEWKLVRALAYQNNARPEVVCNLNRVQNLKDPAKGFVNDWLTVTNWVPPVNDA